MWSYYTVDPRVKIFTVERDFLLFQDNFLWTDSFLKLNVGLVKYFEVKNFTVRINCKNFLP